jgi:hypothetical protein
MAASEIGTRLGGSHEGQCGSILTESGAGLRGGFLGAA